VKQLAARRQGQNFRRPWFKIRAFSNIALPERAEALVLRAFTILPERRERCATFP
jgi:hypothetical protein